MAGLPQIPEQHVDGVSITDLFKGGDVLDREAIYWHYPHYGNQGGTPGASMRMGDYKLIEFFEDNNIELYDLKNDVEEDFNLVEKEPELAAKMHNMLKKWQIEVQAKFPTINPDYKK
jgi:arylsulfatase A-like enzyme